MFGTRENPIRESKMPTEVFLALSNAKNLWRQKSKEFFEEHGDQGTCVLGAGIEAYVVEKGCRKPRHKNIIHAHDISPAQGASVWEHSVKGVIAYLAEHGVEAHYNPGRMD